MYISANTEFVNMLPCLMDNRTFLGPSRIFYVLTHDPSEYLAKAKFKLIIPLDPGPQSMEAIPGSVFGIHAQNACLLGHQLPSVPD